MRLLFDVTRLQQSGLHTGIQRVVRCLLAGCQRAGIPALAVAFAGRHWRSWSQLAPHPLQGLGEREPLPGQPFEPQAGDVLLMFDASWYLDPWPAVDAALQRGVRLAGMVHDLLPLRRPEWFRPALRDDFARHLHQLAARAERLFVPSRTVAAQLQAWLGAPHVQVQVLAHGGDFLVAATPPSASATATEPPPLPWCWPAQRNHLVVATLEPRKQHARVLDAFEALWAAGNNDALVFIGARGWKVDALVQRLVHHPERGRRLHLHEGLSDPQLAQAYRQASSLIYLSRDEGFGLPVLEAAMQGCPVLAADIPVLHEAGGAWPSYIDPDSTAALQAAIAHLAMPALAEPTHRRRPRRYWQEVAQTLHAALASAPGATQPPGMAADLHA